MQSLSALVYQLMLFSTIIHGHNQLASSHMLPQGDVASKTINNGYFLFAPVSQVSAFSIFNASQSARLVKHCWCVCVCYVCHTYTDRSSIMCTCMIKMGNNYVNNQCLGLICFSKSGVRIILSEVPIIFEWWLFSIINFNLTHTHTLA